MGTFGGINDAVARLTIDGERQIVYSEIDSWVKLHGASVIFTGP